MKFSGIAENPRARDVQRTRKNEKLELPSLTGLRAYAALAVFLVHLPHFEAFKLFSKCVFEGMNYLGVTIFYCPERIYSGLQLC